MEEQLMHLDYDIEVAIFFFSFLFELLFFYEQNKKNDAIFYIGLQNIHIAGNQCGFPVYG
jgi:hypothetical protein